MAKFQIKKPNIKMPKFQKKESSQNSESNKPPKQIKRRLDIWNKIAIAILTIFLVGCISVFFILVNVINDPEGMRFSQDGLQAMASSRIYDTNGKLIYEFGEEIRDDVTYEQLPQNLIDAFLAIEDSRYFDHNGFDMPRFLSAAITNLRTGDFSQGGSTLTMQMIDNAFTKNQEQKLLKEKGSISKYDQVKLKIQEIYLSLVAEQSISKEDIFEYYVNRIWFGSGNSTRGIEKACEYYFGKHVAQLNLEECAFLAGCINAPSTYNPLANQTDFEMDHLKAGQQRRNATLDLMLQHGYITQEEHDLACSTKLSYSLKQTLETSDDPNQSYIDLVIEETQALTGQDPSIIPMDIYTALNTSVQKEADKICDGETVNFPNEVFDVGFGILDNETGEIIAIGPGRTYHTDNVKINNATDRKQPGSSMKPLMAYSSTFDILGWSTEHAVEDKKKDYWHSGVDLQNSDGTYSGTISLAYALGVSKNTCAAGAMLDLIDAKGYNYWIDFCEKLGFDKDVCEEFTEQYSIGGGSMYASPIQQANAYSIFANKGKRVDAHTVRYATRRTDKKKFETDTTPIEVISEEAAFMMSFLLYKVVHGGYQNFNEKLTSTYPVYGKSGTSDWGTDGLQWGIPQSSIRDEWSVGYTSQFTIAVWSGYTRQYEQQGYYIPTYSVSAYTVAFDISHYMLDFCEQYGTYTDIEIPAGVSPYNGGYIKTEFLSQGDKTTTSTGTVEKQEEEKEEEEEDKDYTEETACTSTGGTWDAMNNECVYDWQTEEDPSQTDPTINPTYPDDSGETWTNPTTDPNYGGGTDYTDPNLYLGGWIQIPRNWLSNIFELF